jgi:large subunit ribosomal protein L17
MKHHNNTRKFGRESNQRKAFIKGLASALIINGKIETTIARAKELRPFVERLVTQAKANTLASKKLVLAKLYNHKIENDLLHKQYAPKYKEVQGGYTRIIKKGQRLSDASEMAIIEFI